MLFRFKIFRSLHNCLTVILKCSVFCYHMLLPIIYSVLLSEHIRLFISHYFRVMRVKKNP